MEEAHQPPEISHKLYGSAVLQLPVDKSEDHVDLELLAKAHALGIRASLPSVSHYRRPASVALSDCSVSTLQEQLFSTASDGSVSTYLTPHSSIIGPPSPDVATADAAAAKQSKTLSFSPYEKLLTHHDSSPDPSKSTKSSKSTATADSSAQSIFSVSTKKGLSGIRSRMMLRKKSSRTVESSSTCFACRQEFVSASKLYYLSCGHGHCTGCLRHKIESAVTDETKMPPRCCGALSPSAIQGVLDPVAQEIFLRAVVQYSTPRESRIFCSSTTCGEFIPRRKHVDPKAPFTVTCHRCHTRVCTLCKRDAHPIGRDCPEDAEVAASSKVDDKPCVKRCYKCRGLVESTRNWSHLTCDCQAQFCSLCGGVWDPTVGCPNICSNEDEASKGRDSDDGGSTARASLDALAEAEKRASRHPDVQGLQASQQREMDRFCDFRTETKDTVRSRHALQKTIMGEKHLEEETKLKEKHVTTAAQLEDRQITEEMELRSALEQGERTIKVRIKHMEAYCEGLGRNPAGHEMPPRVVTEQNLRALGHQYNLRDDMERQHQAKINMMRDRQTNRMEELLQRQRDELAQMVDKQKMERSELDEKLAHEEAALQRTFESRNSRLTARWTLAIEVLCKELEEKTGDRFAPTSPPDWPAATETGESMVFEEHKDLIS